MPSGSRPGERRGGRAKGTLNKATRERLAEVQEVVKNLPVAVGVPYRAKDVMALAMSRFLEMALACAPGTEQYDEKRFVASLRVAADIAKDLAPYESSRLAPTVLKEDEGAVLKSGVTAAQLKAEIMKEAAELGFTFALPVPEDSSDRTTH